MDGIQIQQDGLTCALARVAPGAAPGEVAREAEAMIAAELAQFPALRRDVGAHVHTAA
jgi:hypothetical protein